MSASKTEQRVLRNVIRKLGPDAQVSGEGREHLKALRIYLDTWVIAPLELLAKEDRTSWDLRHADDLAR
jgi:hypothetical protein